MNTEIIDGADPNQISRCDPGASIKRHLISAFTRTAAFAAVLAAVNMFLFGTMTATDNSMFPQIRAGDLAVYFKLCRPAGQDAVVYDSKGVFRIGRIAASEGDVVEAYESGEIMINGAVQPAQERNGIFAETRAQSGGIRYPVELGDDQYFILGDNRSSARDSRTYGAVEREDIKGVIFILIRRQAV